MSKIFFDSKGEDDEENYMLGLRILFWNNRKNNRGILTEELFWNNRVKMIATPIFLLFYFSYYKCSMLSKLKTVIVPDFLGKPS